MALGRVDVDTCPLPVKVGNRQLRAPVVYGYRGLTTRFAAVPRRVRAEPRPVYALDVLAEDPDIGVMVPVDRGFPSGTDARMVPFTDPESWKLSAKEGWPSFNAERQWLLGRTPSAARAPAWVPHHATKTGGGTFACGVMAAVR